MQTISCSEARVVAFDAFNPLDLADEVNLWLKNEGETLEVIDWSYCMGVNSNQEKKQHAVHSMALLCRIIRKGG